MRRALTELGSAALVDVAAVAAALSQCESNAVRIDPVPDPEARDVPELVSTAFGSARPIPAASWAALEPVERYALFKIAQRGRLARLDRAYRELIGASALSSHLEPSGGVRMVNVGGKVESLRRAVAESQVSMNPEAFEKLARHQVPKGDVLGTARLAGIMAAKRTSEWIPLCHPLRLTRIGVELTLDAERHSVSVVATVEAFDRTGVEMEALVAASAAALTIYDMLKSFDRGMRIGPTQVREKSGGRSGDFRS
jgi:cyclic pyranopterin phosphate synthase